MEEMSNILVSLSVEHEGRFDKVYNCINNNIKPKKHIKRDELKYKAVTAIDKEYPDIFKKMNCPPIVFYYDGDLSLLDQKETKMITITFEDETRMFIVANNLDGNDRQFDECLVCCENIDNLDRMLNPD